MPLKNSPLREIIAEVRWGAGHPRKPQPLVIGGNELNYLRFGAEVSKFGYAQLERTMPEGFPTPGGAVVYRYRRVDEAQNTLYQLGQGVFTTNGLPPYSSWEEFKVVLRQGLEALWSLSGGTAPDPKIWLMVRYIDGFDQAHLGNMPPSAFYERIVGVKFERPQVFEEFPGNNARESMRFFFSRMDGEGQELQFEVGEGHVVGMPATILNTTVISAEQQDKTVDEVVEMFGKLQDAAHKLFFQMIERDKDLEARLHG